MRNTPKVGRLSILAVGVLIAGTAHAAPTIDEDGVGFVPKGDVQYTFGWNNHALQEHADDIRFRVNWAVISEVSWICSNSSNQQTQERKRTTETIEQQAFATATRTRNQVTGFLLNGWSGEPTQSSETDGPPLNSCPSGPWSLTTPAGTPVVVSVEGPGLQVSNDAGENWVPLNWQSQED